jgi:hypothetical protein
MTPRLPKVKELTARFRSRLPRAATWGVRHCGQKRQRRRAGDGHGGLAAVDATVSDGYTRAYSMLTLNWSTLSIPELLAAHCAILGELKKREVVRSKNNPTGDYAEWLVSTNLGLRLESNSAKGYDATDANGVRYQIKGRRITPDNPSTQLSVIRNLDTKGFDVLIAVVFDESWQVRSAAKIPHDIVCKLATFRDHVNGHVMYLRPSVFTHPTVEDISSMLT